MGYMSLKVIQTATIRKPECKCRRM